MLFINKSIICSQVSTPNLPDDIEAMFVDINLRNQKILLIGAYKPPSQDASYFVNNIIQQISKLKYDELILMGDFNLEDTNPHLDMLKTELDLENLIKQPTCFKSLSNPSCIDHIWVDGKKRFNHSGVLETGLSDFHKMTVTDLKTTFSKAEPRTIIYHPRSQVYSLMLMK